MTNTPAAPDTATEPVKVLAYKGFAPDLTCDPTGENPFRYAEGQTYEHDGDDGDQIQPDVFYKLVGGQVVEA
jgi:hypothetical protein